MKRPVLFLLAIVALTNGASGDAFAQKDKRGVNATLGKSQRAPEAEYEKGNEAFDRKEWNDARAHYDAALRGIADPVPSLLNRGRVALATGKLNAAAADFQKALELKPELAAGRTYLAAVLLDQGRHADALVQAGKALELDPKQALAWYTRGTAQVHKGEFNKAIEDLNEAARLVPNDPRIFNNRGVAWQKLGDEAKAKADFERRDRLNAKQDAKLKMEQALARFHQIDFQVKTYQNGRAIRTTTAGPRGTPVQVVRVPPPELLRLRDEVW